MKNQGFALVGILIVLAIAALIIAYTSGGLGKSQQNQKQNTIQIKNKAETDLNSSKKSLEDYQSQLNQN